MRWLHVASFSYGGVGTEKWELLNKVKQLQELIVSNAACSGFSQLFYFPEIFFQYFSNGAETDRSTNINQTA